VACLCVAVPWTKCFGAPVATSKKKPSAPLTFDLPESLISKIGQARRGHGLKSASEVVRLALARFDLNSFEPNRDPHRQISVRIPGETRITLKRAAKSKFASVGEVIRAALEKLPAKAPSVEKFRSRRG